MRPLQVSGLLYVVPSWYAVRNKWPVLRWVMPLLVGTSWLNHSAPLSDGRHTHAALTWVRTADIGLAHITVLYHVWLCASGGTGEDALAPRCCLIYLATCYSFVVYHLDLSRSDRWHASFHAVSAAASALLLRERRL